MGDYPNIRSFISGININQVLRMMIGITFFSAAYMAENVRGGLQGIPSGQHEAAQAVGLNYVQTTLCLSSYHKHFGLSSQRLLGNSLLYLRTHPSSPSSDSSISLGVAKSIIANPDWLGLQAEVYLFAAIIYFVFCYSMSYASQDIETDIGRWKAY